MTPLTKAQMRQLMADLNPARIAQRSQSGSRLSYLEAWDVRASLIRIFGIGGFSADLMEPVKIVRIDEVPKSKGDGTNYRVLALATVRLYIPQLDASYTESAAQSQALPDLGEATDFAVKTAESDALKRAAVNLGTQFGMSLYDNGATADVVRVILAPGQAEILHEIRHPEAAQAVAETGANLETGEIPPEPPAAATAAAAAQVSKAFGGQ